MPGEKNLAILLQNMQPTLNAEQYVFCTVPSLQGIDVEQIIFFFREQEGITIVAERSVADALGLEYSYTAAWITLKVHSALDAVGLTAAFSRALAEADISCNVIAGYFHDHIFVDINDAEKAVLVLKTQTPASSAPPESPARP
jgi:uncharacterized protein